MRTLKQRGERRTHKNSTDRAIASGEGVAVGELFGVSVAAIMQKASGTLTLVGVHELPKKENDVVTAGQKLHWNTKELHLTVTEEGNTFAGVAFNEAGQHDKKVEILLKQGPGA